MRWPAVTVERWAAAVGRSLRPPVAWTVGFVERHPTVGAWLGCLLVVGVLITVARRRSWRRTAVLPGLAALAVLGGFHLAAGFEAGGSPPPPQQLLSLNPPHLTPKPVWQVANPASLPPTANGDTVLATRTWVAGAADDGWGEANNPPGPAQTATTARALAPHRHVPFVASRPATARRIVVPPGRRVPIVSTDPAAALTASNSQLCPTPGSWPYPPGRSVVGCAPTAGLLTLPGDRWLTAQAQRIAGSNRTVALTPALISADEVWISRHLDYSTAAIHAPAGWDPVAWALEHGHRGWCVVAAVALADLLMVQTTTEVTIATGWYVPATGLIRASDAHAWDLVALGSLWVPVDPTTLLPLAPPPPPGPSPVPALAALGLLVAAVLAVRRAVTPRLVRAERRARRRLGRPRRPDEALGTYLAAAGLESAPAGDVWRSRP